MDTRASPSIKSNELRLPPPIQLRPLETESREAVAALIEKFLGANWRISHHLNAEKDAHIMSSVPIYVWQRQGRNRAGLLILQAGQPAIYWNTAEDCPYTLKLQVPATFTHSGPWVIVATLSKLERLLTLEDVWVAEGRSLLREARYSERWPRLNEAFGTLNKQQYFLGCELRLVEPMSFSQFLQVVNAEPEEGTVWEFQPDVPLRRRLVWMIPGKGRKLLGGATEPTAIPSLAPNQSLSNPNAGFGTAFIPLIHCKGPAPKHKAHTKPTTRPQPRIHGTAIPQLRAALLRRDTQTALPDSYWLEAGGGESLGRICVPRLTQSQQLREAFAGGKNPVIVEVSWNDNFSKYEVSRVLPEGTTLSYKEMFYECVAENN